MTKPPKSVFVCQECGAQAQKWLGRCADCGAWNSYVEERAGTVNAAIATRYAMSGGSGAKLYADVQISAAERMSTGIGEFDRVLGG